MRVSDLIEEFIKDLFDEDDSDLIEIQRNHAPSGGSHFHRFD